MLFSTKIARQARDILKLISTSTVDPILAMKLKTGLTAGV
jgi:hypothetical protein